MNSGCNNQMTGNRSCFVNLDEGVHSQLKLGVGKLHNIKERGSLQYKKKEVTLNSFMMFFMFLVWTVDIKGL